MTRSPLRWGVLSTARIGLKAVVPALQKAASCEVVAIASRDLARARRAADALGIAAAYGSYQALLDDPAVDAVYNPLPNSLHKAWTIKALEAGKHVLCEKPLGLGAKEALEMHTVAERTNKSLTEAFMYRFHPRSEGLVALAQGGRVGALRLVRAAFSFRVKDPANIRLDPALGGGALYDVGCYCVNLCRSLAAEEPEDVQAFARWTGASPGEGVDAQLIANLRFASGLLAQFDCALELERREFVEVVGETGRLVSEATFVTGKEASVITETREGSAEIAHRFPGADAYQAMVEDVAGRVLTGEPPRYGPGDAVANMRVLDALYRSARRGGQPETVG